MSGTNERPKVRISTSYHNGKPGGTPSINSPASARPDVMNNKRPARHRSPGKSPPPKRRPSAQDRYDAPASPPLSRKNSISGLPANVPTGPRHNIDHYRPGKGDGPEKRHPNGPARRAGDEIVSRRESAGHALSPVSNGSGNSTPVHPAPQAPSMVPGSATSLSGHPPQGSTGRGGVPTTQAIQRLKDRKRAIANESKRSVDMQTLLSVQQAEIKQFAKERAEMSEKLANFQGLSERVTQLEAQLKAGTPPSVDPKPLQDALERITELEKLKSLTNRIGAVELTSSKHAVGMKSVASLIADVASLNNWKETQSAVISKDLVVAEARLEKRITESQTKLDTLSSDIAVVNTFKKDTENLKLQSQINDLFKQIDVVAEKEHATYNKATKTVDDIGMYIGAIHDEYDFRGVTLVDRIKDLRDDLRDIQGLHKQDWEAMTAGQAKIAQEQAKIITRLTALERKPNSGVGPGFTKVGSKVADSSAPTDDTKKRMDHYDKDVQGIRESVDALQLLAQQIPQLSEKLIIVEAIQGNTDSASNARNIPEDMASRKVLDELATKVRGFETDLAQISRRASQLAAPGGPIHTPDPADGSSDVLTQIAEIKSFAETINDALEIAEMTIAGHTTKLDLLDTDIPQIVQVAVDAISATTSTEIEILGQKVRECNQEIVLLKQKLDQPPLSGIESLTNTAASLQEELSSLRADVTLESASREGEVRDIKQQLLSKADIVTVNNHKDQLHHTIRILQDQYNNISTDDLYQKMIHWFMKTYPSNMGTVVNQITALQQDLETLQSLATQVASVQSLDFASLTSLASKAPEIITMVNTTTELQQLPKTWAKLEVACNDAKEAMTKAQAADAKATQQAERVTQVNLAVNSLQKSLSSLNGADSRFAKSQDLRDLTTELGALEQNLTAEKQARTLSIKELKVAAGVDPKQILELSTRVDRVDTLIDEIKPRVTKVEESALELRTDVNVINHNYIEPNREFLGLLGSMFILVGELQKVVECLNQNSPNVPLEIQWTNDMKMDFPGQQSNVPEPRPKGSKGKTKR